MWKRHFKIMSTALLSFSVIINGEYSEHAVLSNCHVTINVSSWSLLGSCFVSSTFDQYKCYWIREQRHGEDVIMPSTLIKQINGEQDTWICSFNSSLPKQEGKYRYYIVSEPQPTNPYSFYMLINSTDDVKIIKSALREENGVTFSSFTCNASSYSPDVRYVWSAPCQFESLIDGTSVCNTSLKDQKTEITCIAVYSAGVVSADNKVLTGGGLGMIGILSFAVGIAVYLKRRKGSETTSEFNDHTDHTDETAAKISSASMSDSQLIAEDAESYQNVDHETVDHETVDHETVDHETVDHETAIALKNSVSTPLTKTILFSQMNAVGRPMAYI